MGIFMLNYSSPHCGDYLQQRPRRRKTQKYDASGRVQKQLARDPAGL
jgi:hypothetical protein